MIKYLLTAAAVSGLLAGAAVAQDKGAMDHSMPMDSSKPMDSSMPMDSSRPMDSSMPADSSMPMDKPMSQDSNVVASSTMPVGPNATLTSAMVSNGPIPDTAENRALYGGPQSNAGKRTAAKGN